MAKLFKPNEFYKNLSLQDIDGEEWKDLHGYEGLFQISNMGRVKSLERRDVQNKLVSLKILKQDLAKNGYLRVPLRKNGIQVKKFVHRLVALNFVENPLFKPNVNHKKAGFEYRTLNCYWNLEWSTQKENIAHAIESKTFNRFGEKHHAAKLTEIDVLEIRKLLKNGEILKDVSKMFGISITNVSDIKTRKIWKNVK